MKYLVEIQAGEGGQDAKLFVEDLYDMYCGFATRNDIALEEVYHKEGKIGFIATGKNASRLEKESGQHVVQRCPPTENKGRRHTSAINVSILRIEDKVERRLDDRDLEVITQVGSGPGGQHRNKTETAVRMKHIPTGIHVIIDGRSQDSNKQEARAILETRVAEHFAAIEHAAKAKRKKDQISDNKRRTYNFIEGRVRDHVSGKQTDKVKRVMKGELDLLT